MALRLPSMSQSLEGRPTGKRAGLRSKLFFERPVRYGAADEKGGATGTGAWGFVAGKPTILNFSNDLFRRGAPIPEDSLRH